MFVRLYRNGIFERELQESRQETLAAISHLPEMYTLLPNDLYVPDGTITYAEHRDDVAVNIYEHKPYGGCLDE